MAPSPASTGAATPSPSLAPPSPPTRSTPSPLTTARGGVAVLCWLWRHWSTWATKGQPSCTPLSPKSSFGIDDTPSVATLNGSPGAALPPSHSSAGNGASGSIAGLPCKPSNARSASAYGWCVAEPRRTPCRFGVIVDHLQPRPTNPSTLRSSVTPSVIVVCRYHDGRGRDDTIVLVVARVEGIGLVLQVLEGGRCVCLFVFGQHRLLWHH